VKRILLAALAAVLAAAVVPQVALAALHAGETAPAFDLPHLEGGGSVSLASLHGKPVYLNFFASWCAPCNDEAPAISSLYKKYHGRGLVVVGIDEQESPNKGSEFVKQHSLSYPAVGDEDGKAGEAYGAIGLPIHIFIDRQGKISTYRLGEMDPGEIDAAIQKIL
jgi:cytochrome c biogenesis protein CcmG, thiol:disulfide interchange protein DsbE